MVRTKPEAQRTEVRCNLCDDLIGFECPAFEGVIDPALLDFNGDQDGWMFGYALDGSGMKYNFDYCKTCAPIVIAKLKEIKFTISSEIYDNE